jgi:hypothetical protein
MTAWEIAGLIAAALALYWGGSWPFWGGPKPRSRELAMAVWGAFGPYIDAEHAAEMVS